MQFSPTFQSRLYQAFVIAYEYVNEAKNERRVDHGINFHASKPSSPIGLNIIRDVLGKGSEKLRKKVLGKASKKK